MGNIDIIKILGVGLSGFGFLLMFLAYKLLNKIITERSTNALIHKSINRYMLVCFVMTVTVGVFTFISTEYKKETIASQNEQIKNDETAINLLVTTNKNNSIADSVISAAGNDNTVPGAKKDQEKILNDLSVIISSEKDPKTTAQFTKYKDNILKIHDSLNMPNLSKPEIESLKRSYSKYNDSVTKLTLDITNRVKPGLTSRRLSSN
jgi:hypothetical protein